MCTMAPEGEIAVYQREINGVEDLFRFSQPDQFPLHVATVSLSYRKNAMAHRYKTPLIACCVKCTTLEYFGPVVLLLLLLLHEPRCRCCMYRALLEELVS